MKQSSARLLKESEIFDTKGETDTIRLWENYRDQALLWRAIALLQIPTTFIALILSLIMWATRSVTLNVPARPLPGIIMAKEIPDVEFVESATEYINLIATYQPATARRQFSKARELVHGDMLERFDAEIMEEELKAVEATHRMQTFFVDPTLTRISRDDSGEVSVQLEGIRAKVISGKGLPEIKTRFSVYMSTIPKNLLNPYGIVVTNVLSENIDQERTDKQDRN